MPVRTAARVVAPRQRAFAWLVAALALGAASWPARADSPLASALLSVRDADPLELARVVARHSDRALLDLLAKPADAAVCLAAVRAAPWLRRPERALPALAELGAGRDSLLAPSAARAALTIASQLDFDRLAAREVAPHSLAAVRAALLGIAARQSVGADVRALMAAAAEQLRAAGVP